MANGPWYPTLTPTEHADSERSSTYPQASADLRTWAEEGRAVEVRVRHLPGPDGGWPAATRAPGELFLYNGAVAFDRLGGARITRVDTAALRVAWTRQLSDTRATGEWNYPGSVGVLSDGYVYAAYGFRLSRLHPETGEVLGTVELPTGQSRLDTTYNGFVALPDGNLVAKSMHRKPGTRANGFWALARGGLVGTPSDLPVVDPRTLRVISNLTAPEHLLGRVTAAVHRGKAYVYASGINNLYRFAYEAGTLRLDTDWGPVRYRQEGEAPGSAVTAGDGWIFIQANAGPGLTPFHIHAVSQDDSTRIHRLQPFPGHPLSFNASKLTYDAANRRIYTTDGIIGRLACYDFDPDRGFTRRWEVEQGSYSFLVLVGPPERRVLVSTELVDTWWSWLLRKKLARYRRWLAYVIARERVTWRHPDTGALLARSRELPAGLAVVPGDDGAIYYPTVFRGLYELKVQPHR